MIQTILDVFIGVLLYLYDVFQRLLNLKFPFRLKLFEWCDVVPDVLKYHLQATLTAQWHHRIPLIQPYPPSHHASNLLTQLLSNITDADTTPYTIIDFCSGAGGPLPTIERDVNAARQSAGKPPITFRMSDLHPNLDAWIPLASHSAHLSFLPQPVDALRPPPSTISVSARHDPGDSLLDERKRYAYDEVGLDGKIRPDPRRRAQRDRDIAGVERGLSAGTKTVHLFCLSFHHFDDAQARTVVSNALRGSDAFCFLELQERTLGCVAMLALEPLLLFLVGWVWFWGEWVHLALIYTVPVLPVLHGWDGLVSCFRTRTFKEVRGMIDEVIEGERGAKGIDQSDWTISEVRARHTWPAGYLNAVVGIRKDVRKGMS